MKFYIRNEEEKDYRDVEMLTREAFWNLYRPGCDEHYLTHVLRTSPDFIPELDFVAILDDKIVGNIMFTKSYIISNDSKKHETITFGPLSVLPAYQKQGIGKALVEHAKEAAKKLGYRAILIYGFPSYYKKLGFVSAKEYGISNSEGLYPAAHQVLELYEGALSNISGKAYESESMYVSEEMADEFDKRFTPKKKEVTTSQKQFEEMVTKYL